MRTKTKRGKIQLRWMSWILGGTCCLLLVAAAPPLVLAQTGYDLSWWTVDGG